MNWATLKLLAVVVLAGVLIVVGGVFAPGPDVLWTVDACPAPVETCGGLPLGVIGSVVAAVVGVEIVVTGERVLAGEVDSE